MSPPNSLELITQMKEFKDLIVVLIVSFSK